MEYVTKEQIEAVAVKARRASGESKAETFYAAIALIPLNAGLIITSAEWPMKGKPNLFTIPRRHKVHGAAYKTNTLENEQGWLITRVR